MKTVETRLGPFQTWDTGTVTRALESRGDWDEHVGIALLAAQPGGVALDLGAHIGWFSRLLTEYHDRVLALEPFPATFALLRENLRWCTRVESWPVAAYSYPVLQVYADWLESTDKGANCYLPILPGVGPTEHRAVGDLWVLPAIRLDDYLLPETDVHVIKVDCQGADLHALQGLQQTIRRCRPLIVFEWEAGLAAHHGHTWGDYQDWFHLHHYSIARISPDFWDYVATPIRRP